MNLIFCVRVLISCESNVLSAVHKFPFFVYYELIFHMNEF